MRQYVISLRLCADLTIFLAPGQMNGYESSTNATRSITNIEFLLLTVEIRCRFSVLFVKERFGGKEARAFGRRQLTL